MTWPNSQVGQSLQVIIQSAVGEEPRSSKPRPLAPSCPLCAGAGHLPAGLKADFPGFLHLVHGGQGAIESLAEVSGLRLRDAVATIFLHVEYTCVAAGYIQIYGRKQKFCINNLEGLRSFLMSNNNKKPNTLLRWPERSIFTP